MRREHDPRRMLSHAVRPDRKHTLLLGAIVVVLVGQPLFGHRSAIVSVGFDLLFGAICLGALVVVVEPGWLRRVAMACMLFGFASNFIHFVWLRQESLAVAFHLAIAACLALVVAAILGDILSRQAITGDQIVGAVCGYLLAGIAWAQLYAVAYVLVPGAFTVNPAVVWRLSEWHSQRALFDYMSFTTLTTLGYSDIGPAGPPVYSLMWLEVVFGQFYMAVIVAQLVGLRLAAATSGR